ncbi:ubiquitin-associated domain-containing protein 2 isoform X5 [Hippopotamus amphibius kiboko]|uniref:ubiquitin-associated domain-containing protein 2 isoform X5 n=1 Tax=Hippopotamus amphibius kiboko TaxID=575201 RepID=UPI0025970E2D|nr:ubiquitin-associated domain-containing protein 2 isoform X5 [Hippopotamus amphibius kiboko]
MRYSQAAPVVESSCRIRRPARSAPARSPGSLHLRFPSPVPRGGSGSGGTMFTSTGSSGLYKAPVSKSLLLLPSALSLLLALLLPHCQRFFLYDLQAVKDDFQIWRLISGRIICLDLKDTFCSSLLIYNFRIFERRYGSRKFASFLLGSWVLSAVGDLILVEAVRYSFGITAARNLPSGFLAPVFALFVPFYCSIPSVQVAHILGPLSITNKTLIYILGLQLFTSGSYIWIVAISGLAKKITDWIHSNMYNIKGKGFGNNSAFHCRPFKDSSCCPERIRGVRFCVKIKVTVSPLHRSLQVANFQRCKRAFTCPVMMPRSKHKSSGDIM